LAALPESAGLPSEFQDLGVMSQPLKQRRGKLLIAGGPELPNALGGIVQAYYAHCPLLVISGASL
jgi:hypothetical protein